MCEEAGCSVVVAEGGKRGLNLVILNASNGIDHFRSSGRKSVKKFSKLLTQRIKWREDDMDQGNNSKAPCKMVWEVRRVCHMN